MTYHAPTCMGSPRYWVADTRPMQISKITNVPLEFFCYQEGGEEEDAAVPVVQLEVEVVNGGGILLPEIRLQGRC